MKFITVYIKPSLIFNKLSNASALKQTDISISSQLCRGLITVMARPGLNRAEAVAQL